MKIQIQRNFLFLAVIGAAVLGPVTAGWTQSGDLPLAKVLIIDRQNINAQSLVGQDIQRQIQELRNNLQVQLEGEQAEIQAIAEQLERQRGNLTQEAFQARAQEYELRAQEFNKTVQEKQSVVQRALGLADNEIDRALRPLLRELMNRRSANFILDKSQVAIHAPAIDITADAIGMLDKKLPTLALDISGLQD